MKKAEHILSQAVKTVVTILLLALTVLVTYTVILRYIFNGGVPAAEELVRYLFVWSAFFGIVLGVQEKSHMSLTFLYDSFPKLRPYLKGIYYVCSYVFWGCHRRIRLPVHDAGRDGTLHAAAHHAQLCLRRRADLRGTQHHFCHVPAHSRIR